MVSLQGTCNDCFALFLVLVTEIFGPTLLHRNNRLL